MKYKIMAVDMDGTLLNDDKYISDYNLSMIHKAVKSGIKFVVCSGRMPCGLKFYEETIAKSQPMICCNGAVILDENRNAILSESLDRKSTLQVIDILREKKDTYFHFYDEKLIYGEQFSYAIEHLYNFSRSLDRRFRTDIRLVSDSKEYIANSSSDFYKIVVIDKDLDYLEELRNRIDKVEGLETTKSGAENIEIISKGVSKGNGLKILANHYGVSIDECIAVGNDENDISMIKCAGFGIAVSNARDIVKKYAAYITNKDNNNGAIGEIVEKVILK
ncbi:Cof-type HAD-IIB family hydrolase [Clostridium sp. DJ247]|uniref:Cof-type HAD-IIB family hydrolase n=1 Tax=Clostridium sp. DJ247 TaxID=2726188 RepID=UPI0016295BC2|nr:Cof-type HAD-IIB family hydrolase [Clostridium sp. DJ247]MBC2580363.1 HAD family phosphatase [Clostridium sp. DJ247]